MKKKKTPEMIDLPVETLEEIKLRVNSGALLEEDKKIVLAIIGTYSWLMSQLRSTKLTIHRLKKVFGFSTEKLKNIGSKKGPPADFRPEGTSANAVLSLDNLQGINNGIPEKK